MKGVARATVRPRAMATGARPAYEEVAQIAAIGFVHLHGSTVPQGVQLTTTRVDRWWRDEGDDHSAWCAALGVGHRWTLPRSAHTASLRAGRPRCVTPGERRSRPASVRKPTLLSAHPRVGIMSGAGARVVLEHRLRYARFGMEPLVLLSSCDCLLLTGLATWGPGTFHCLWTISTRATRTRTNTTSTIRTGTTPPTLVSSLSVSTVSPLLSTLFSSRGYRRRAASR
jgi:hypothetical protein